MSQSLPSGRARQLWHQASPGHQQCSVPCCLVVLIQYGVHHLCFSWTQGGSGNGLGVLGAAQDGSVVRRARRRRARLRQAPPHGLHPRLQSLCICIGIRSEGGRPLQRVLEAAVNGAADGCQSWTMKLHDIMLGRRGVPIAASLLNCNGSTDSLFTLMLHSTYRQALKPTWLSFPVHASVDLFVTKYT